MTLLRQIQDAAADSESDLPTLLRRTKILAARLQHDRLRQWCDKELDGYSDEDELPGYRIVRTASYGDFYGPFQSGVKNAPIPLMCLPEEWREWATWLKLLEGVGSYIETLKSHDQSDFQVPWLADYVVLGQSSVKLYKHMVLGSAWRVLPRGSIALVLDSVRNRVLSLALELEQEVPLAGERQPGDPPPISPETVASIVNNTIFVGDYHNVSIGSQETQQTIVHKVRQGDFDSLREALLSIGLESSDVEELDKALAEDPPITPSADLGPRAKAWMAKASQKLAAAAGEAAITTVFQVLAKAVAIYAGIDVDRI